MARITDSFRQCANHVKGRLVDAFQRHSPKIISVGVGMCVGTMASREVFDIAGSQLLSSSSFSEIAGRTAMLGGVAMLSSMFIYKSRLPDSDTFLKTAGITALATAATVSLPPLIKPLIT